MTESILESIKKVLNVPSDYEAFNADLIMHINSVFSTLNQLGVGPRSGFMIEDQSTTWDSFLDGDLRLNNVKSYVALRVRLLFDPPTTGFHVQAVTEQIKELEWRINVQREEDQWTEPPM